MDQSQEEINIDEYIQNALAIIHPILSSHTYALFGVDNRDRPELFASSVLIKVDDIAVLVTAAHAICEIEKYGSAIHVGANKSIYELTNDFVRSSKGGDDQLDLAALSVNGTAKWLMSH